MKIHTYRFESNLVLHNVANTGVQCRTRKLVEEVESGGGLAYQICVTALAGLIPRGNVLASLGPSKAR